MHHAPAHPGHATAGGFSTTGLLSALLITAIVFAAGAPNLGYSLARMRANTTIQEWLHTLQMARDLAIEHKSGVITLCGSTDGQRCSSDWSGNWLLFADRNNNRRHDGDEVLYQQGNRPAKGRLDWKASGGRPYVRFTREGYAMEFGTLTYCAPDGDPRLARRITVNLPGRPRLERDRDGDGIVEDADGKALDCTAR